jgi:hypothetical protein
MGGWSVRAFCVPTVNCSQNNGYLIYLRYGVSVDFGCHPGD